MRRYIEFGAIIAARHAIVTAMDYLVLDTSERLRRVALLDRFGSFHVAAVQSSLPASGASLKGDEAALGAAVLTDAAQGLTHSVQFEAVACPQQTTFDML